MIKIKKELNTLKDAIKIIENMNPEVDFVFCPEGIIVKAVDTSAISMASFRMTSAMFEQYDIEEEMVCTFQVALLYKILNAAGKKEVDINFDGTKVTFSSPKKSFSLKYFVGTKDDRPEPEVTGTSQWTMDPKDLFTIISNFGDFSEVVKLESTGEELKFYTKSNLIDGEIMSEATPVETVDDHCWYSLPNFQMIEKIQKIFDTIQLDFSKDNPCQIVAETDNIKFKWILAPRVDDEN